MHAAPGYPLSNTLSRKLPISVSLTQPSLRRTAPPKRQKDPPSPEGQLLQPLPRGRHLSPTVGDGLHWRAGCIAAWGHRRAGEGQGRPDNLLGREARVSQHAGPS
jgi:hypothetical protein